MKGNTPIFKIVAGTTVHGSLDVHICSLIVDKLIQRGWDARFQGYFSFEEVPNGEIYILKHERRHAWKYTATASQGDAEMIIQNRDTGIYPSKTTGQLTGHRHSAQGTLESFKGIAIINVPGWVLFLPYPSARRMMHYYQPDIGCWVMTISKAGRVKWQKWLYPPFIYNDYKNAIIESHDPRRTYVDVNKFTVEPEFQFRLSNAEYTIVILSDTHIGEKEAPCPERFTWKNRDIRPSLTRANYRMNAYWYHFIYMCKYVWKPNELWHCGDVVAGTNPFERYRNPLMTNLEEESEAFVALVEAYRRSEKQLKEAIKRNLRMSNI